jgi:thiamine-monophosphate kinase
MKLSQIGELTLLDQIRKRFKKKSDNIIVGIGDDAAVLKPTDKNLLVTTDMMVEGVHFDLSFTTPYQLGFKLISVNVSDIYAMAGKPLYLLLNIAVKKDTEKKFIDKLFDGIKDAMNLYDTILIGGDLSATKSGMALSATVIGCLKKHILRSGANVGDRIYVTGYLGDSACGLELMKRIKRPVPLQRKCSAFSVQRSTPPHPPLGKGGNRGGLNSNFQTLKSELLKLGLSWNTVNPLLRRHLLPEARDSKKFARYATSMIDISDGLLIDLSRLCTESRVGARIYIANIPLSPELKKAAAHLDISPLKLALSGGEDYEILFTAPVGKKVKAIYIGEIIKSGRFIVDSSGREKPFLAKGYQHFCERK